MKLLVVLLFSAMVLVQSKVNPFRKYVQKKTVKKDPTYVNQATLLNSNFRCHGEDNGCCTTNNPCDAGDGDCDFSSQCARDLVCGKNNCDYFGEEGDDCCEQRKVQHPEAMCNQGKWVIGDGAGGKDDKVGYFYTAEDCFNACLAKRKTNMGANGCTYHRKSYESGKGGCWVEYGMYKVATGWGKARKYQTCYLPYIDASGLRCQGSDNNCCTEDRPCDLHDGDCDNDRQCKGDLVCGKNNCAWGKGDECCMERHVGDEVEEEIEKRASDNPKFEDDIKENMITVEY